ncbi:MAG TPA: TolC family protein [Polyangiales bacterium]
MWRLPGRPFSQSCAYLQLALLAAALGGHSVHAQAAAARPVTLTQALAAVPKAPLREVARLQTSAARNAVDAAGAWPATSVGLTTSLRTARFTPSVSLPLPVFGTVSANKDAARAELSVARAQEAGTELSLRRQAQEAWTELALAQAVASLAAQAAAREQELADVTKSRFDAGEAPRAEVVAAEAESRRAKAEATAAASTVGASSAVLAGVLGWPPEALLLADGGLPEPRAPQPLAAWLARAAAHPEVRAALARANVDAAHVKQAERARWPKLALLVEASIDDPTLPGSDMRTGVGVEVPLLGRTAETIATAQAFERAARAEQDATQRDLGARVVSAYRRVQSARERFRALRDDVLPAQQESVRLSRAAYAEGQQGLIAVIAANRALAEAERGMVGAQADVALAQSELEWSSGGNP